MQKQYGRNEKLGVSRNFTVLVLMIMIDTLFCLFHRSVTGNLIDLLKKGGQCNILFMLCDLNLKNEFYLLEIRKNWVWRQ